MRLNSVVKATSTKIGKVRMGVAFAILCVSNPLFAASTLGDLAGNVTDTFSDITKLITGGAYVAGFALAMVGIFKLKAHKDNPTQIPISTGFALIFVGAALVFLPGLLGVGITTIFGDDASGVQVGPSGTTSLNL